MEGLRRASDQGIRNPSTATGMVDAAITSAVVPRRHLNVGTILDLLGQFRSFNPDDLVTYQVPTEAAPSGSGLTRRSSGTRRCRC